MDEKSRKEPFLLRYERKKAGPGRWEMNEMGREGERHVYVRAREAQAGTHISATNKEPD